MTISVPIISTTLIKDHELGQILFDERFIRTEYQDLFLDNNLDQSVLADFEHIIKIKTSDYICELLQDEEFIEDDIKEQHEKEGCISLIDYSEYDYVHIFELWRADKFVLPPDLEIIRITGYCQGDVAYILTAKTKDDEEYQRKQDYFTNLFYDTPLYGRVNIEFQGENWEYYWQGDEYTIKTDEEELIRGFDLEQMSIETNINIDDLHKIILSQIDLKY